MTERALGRPLVTFLGAAAGVLVLFGAGAYSFAQISDCVADGDVTLDVAAAPEIAPVLAAAVRRFDRSGGECARVRLRTADPAGMSMVLSGQRQGRRPDVWIPDSSLWPALSGAAEVRGSLASSPIVLATAAPVDPSWNLLLGPAVDLITGRSEAGGARARPQVPDPTRSAVGLAALLTADRLLARDPDGRAVFTGLVRAVRESTTPTVGQMFGAKDAAAPRAVLVASRQAVTAHNRRGLGRRAHAAVPKEGSPVLDYPFTITTRDKDGAKAAKRLERAFRDDDTRADLRRHGFDTGRPAPSWTPAVQDVRRVAQAYARLSLPTRMLVLFDISGSMAEKVAPGLNRLQATAQVGQTGLQLLAGDSELGIWEFSTELRGSRDWRERVPIAPLGDRVGSVTQRQHILSDLANLRVKKNGGTGLYESLLAAVRTMQRSHKPEMVNPVLVFTDGRDQDPGGPGFGATLAGLRADHDPRRPVQVILQGFGADVDVGELTRLAEATHGIVQVARTPEESKRLLREAMSRRVCTPNC